MKRNNLRLNNINPSAAISTGMFLAIVTALIQQGASAAALAVPLGVAADFAVLAGAGITFAGASNSTTITGDIGSFTTTTITGIDRINLVGVNHGGDSVTQQGKLDLSSAYADASVRSPNVIYPPDFRPRWHDAWLRC